MKTTYEVNRDGSSRYFTQLLEARRYAAGGNVWRIVNDDSGRPVAELVDPNLSIHVAMLGE